jgi:hypothetical protein
MHEMCQPTWRRMVWERYIGDTFHGKCYTIRCVSIITPFQFDLGYDDSAVPIRLRRYASATLSIDVVKPTCTACARLSKKHGSFSRWNEWSQQQRMGVQSVQHVPGKNESLWRYTNGDVLFAPCVQCMAECKRVYFGGTRYRHVRYLSRCQPTIERLVSPSWHSHQTRWSIAN